MRALETKQQLIEWRRGAAEVAFVPTMGFLHEGHLALIREARASVGEKGQVVVSIFVNPAQFDRAKDLEAYPRDFDRDVKLCEELGVDVVFAPRSSEFYEKDRSISVVETSLSARLCGATRPGHFEGVCLVLTKLFSLLKPKFAIFGQKDYQQLAIVRRLVRDLDLELDVVGVPTVRESDGLAMSSRNTRLTEEMRKLAPHFRSVLVESARVFAEGETSADHLVGLASARLQKISGVKIDYIEIVNGETLQRVEQVTNGDVIAGAVFFGEVRLIDNLVFGGELET